MSGEPQRNRRPDILILGEEVPPCTGGVAQWGYWLARKFAAAGLGVAYAAREDYASDSTRQDEAFTFVPLAGRSWKHDKDGRIFRALWTAWRRWRPRAIVCLNCKVARVPLLLRPLTGWKVAVLAHGMEVTKKGDHLRRRIGLRWVFGSADLAVAVSRYTRARVLEFGVDPDHVQVLPCGVDAEVFSPRDRSRMRARLDLGDRPVVLTLSRLVARKGHDLVIRAMADVLRRVPDAVYLLGGTGEPAYVQHLKGVAEAAGVSGAVRFLGYVEDADLADLYSAADVYAMPSRLMDGGDNYEGFGITYLEANACGVPVIGADSGGVSDAIVDGETGFLVPPDDVPALADRLLRLLGDPSLARRMGAAGRARVLREFSWNRVGGRFLDALEGQTGPLRPRGAGRPRTAEPDTRPRTESATGA